MTDSITPLDTSTLRQNVRLLGDSLGEVIRHSAGEHVFQNIEGIRQASKSAKDAKLTEALFKQLRALDSQQLHLIARGFAAVLKFSQHRRPTIYYLCRHEQTHRRQKRCVPHH